MSKQLKAWMYGEYKSAVEGKDSLLFVNVEKIPAEDVRTLRIQLREQKLQMLVVKNRVFDKTLEELGVTGFRKIANGQTAVIFGTEGEGAAQRAAKILAEWFRKNKNAEISGGMMEGQVSSAAEAQTWKDLPTREEQLSILVGQILNAGGKLVAQILNPGGLLASQIEKKADEGAGD